MKLTQKRRGDVDLQDGEWVMLPDGRIIEGVDMMRADPKLYQAALEARPLLVTQRHYLRRMATVRVYPAWEKEPRPHDSYCTASYLRSYVLDREHYNGSPTAQVFRNWWGIYNDTVGLIERWNSLAMARAHRDGLNYHFARWLMTKELGL